MPVHSKCDVAARHLLELRGQRIVEQEPHAQSAEHLRSVDADGDWHRHQLEHPVWLRQQAETLASHRCRSDRRLIGHHVGGAGLRTDSGEDIAAGVGHEEEGSVEFVLIPVGDFLHGWRIVGVDRRLQFRGIGYQSRHERERLRAPHPQLVDESDRCGHLACQRVLCFAANAGADNPDRGADREDARERARQEDAPLERS